VELYGTLTGERTAPAEPSGEVVRMPTPAERARRANP